MGVELISICFLLMYLVPENKRSKQIPVASGVISNEACRSRCRRQSGVASSNQQSRLVNFDKMVEASQSRQLIIKNNNGRLDRKDVPPKKIQ